MSEDPQVRALQEALRTEHEEWIAEIQRWADRAAAAGVTARERRHREHVARLKAMPYPWEKQSEAA